MVYDSGTDKIILAGIISAGRGCGNVNFPGLYVNAQSYLPWIYKEIKNAENKTN